MRTFELTVERARYEADRARRQYDAVEPENRLVARTLERALEAKLAAQRQAEQTWSPREPADRSSSPTRNRPGCLGPAPTCGRSSPHRPPRSGNANSCCARIIAEVVVTVDTATRTAALRIIWQGGASTELIMALTKTGGHFRATDEDTVDLVRRLADHYDDTTIAMILSRQHRRTGTGLPFTKSRVKSLRVSRGIPAHQPPDTVTADDDDAVVVTVAEAERLLGVGKVTIYRWLRDGFLTGEQLTADAPWRIRIDQAVRDRVVPTVPDGWVGLDQAATTLGVARQTVLHKVQRGELEAVHVNRGRRKGLRINVSSDQAGLFDQPS